MAFDPITSPQDYILLAGKRSPGIAEVLNAASIREWDERGAYAVTGGFSVFKKRKLAHFSVKFTLYTRQDFADWAAWKPIVDQLPKRRGGNTPDSGRLSIEHPILADLGIKDCGVEEVGQPDQVDHGVWAVVIKFIEFRAPAMTLAKPEGAKTTPVDPYDQYIEGLTGQFQRLANE
jgi:hypothetical protein